MHKFLHYWYFEIPSKFMASIIACAVIILICIPAIDAENAKQKFDPKSYTQQVLKVLPSDCSLEGDTFANNDGSSVTLKIICQKDKK